MDAPIFREINGVVNERRTSEEAFRGLLHIKPAKEDEAG